MHDAIGLGVTGAEAPHECRQRGSGKPPLVSGCHRAPGRAARPCDFHVQVVCKFGFRLRSDVAIGFMSEAPCNVCKAYCVQDMAELIHELKAQPILQLVQLGLPYFLPKCVRLGSGKQCCSFPISMDLAMFNRLALPEGLSWQPFQDIAKHVHRSGTSLVC